MFEPMLASKLNPKKVPYPSYVQPKLDGIRCMWDGTNAWTRSQKPHKDHVHRRLDALHIHCDIVATDGELMLPGGSDFNDIQSIVTANNKSIDDGLYYAVYDVIHRDSSASFSRRKDFLRMVETSVPLANIVVVPTHFVHNAEELEEKLEEYLELGYEGLIWRDPNAAYHHGRTTALRKYKRFVDAEFRIVRVLEATGKDAGTAILECEISPDGPRFCVRPKGDLAYRSWLWVSRHDLPGKMYTVRYQNLSKTGVPRFPVGIAVRDYE